MWQKIIDTLSKVEHPIPLAAVTVGLLALLVYYRRSIPTKMLVAAVFIVIAGDITYVILNMPVSTYHVRITVLDPQGRPVDDAKVVTTAGHEALKTSGGYQIEISSDKRPADGKVQFIATEPGTFSHGESTVFLGSDRNPGATITLHVDTDNVTVGGIVEDTNQMGIEGVLVVVVGTAEKVTTSGGGSFTIKANAPFGKQVLLHAEKAGYKAVDQWHPAGDQTAVLILKH